jgi:hypothetical protein
VVDVGGGPGAYAVWLAGLGVDAVLLLGPLYRLTDRSDRSDREIAATYDGLYRSRFDDPDFESIVERDVADGPRLSPPRHPPRRVPTSLLGASAHLLAIAERQRDDAR